jgi:hypothetical protein
MSAIRYPRTRPHPVLSRDPLPCGLAPEFAHLPTERRRLDSQSSDKFGGRHEVPFTGGQLITEVVHNGRQRFGQLDFRTGRGFGYRPFTDRLGDGRVIQDRSGAGTDDVAEDL